MTGIANTSRSSAPATPDHLRTRQSPGARWAFGVAGSLLLAAAILKTWGWVLEPVPSGRLWTLAQVQAETVLALWLLSGLADRGARWVGMAVFGAFAVVNAYWLWTGVESCGCFGPIGVPPWATLIIDLAVLLGLALTGGTGTDSDHVAPRPAWPWGVAAIAVSVPLGAVVLAAEPASLAPDGTNDIVGSGPVLLRPETWIGRRLPLLNHLDTPEGLEQGDWTVLLFRHDCGSCHERMARLHLEQGTRQVAFIEVPPHGPLDTALAPQDRVRIVKLRSDRDWLVQTPVVLRLKDGIVAEIEPDSHPVLAQPATPARVGRLAEEKADAMNPGEAGPQPVAGTPGWEQTSLDLGYVEPGGVVERVVNLHNPSEQSIAITEVVSECSCTQVLDVPAGLPPGSITPVKLRFTALKERTPYAKRVIAVTDSAEADKFILTVTARIGLPLAADPPQIEIAAGTAAPAEMVVSIRNDGAQPVRLLYATSNIPGIAASPLQAAIPPQGLGTLRVRINPVAAIPGSLGTLSVISNSTELPTLVLPVRIAVSP